MTQGSGSDLSKWRDATARTLVAISVAFAVSAGPRARGSPVPQTSNDSGQSAPARNPSESIALEPGKPVELKLTGKHVYTFALGQRQYTRVIIECPKARVNASLLDPSGATFDRLFSSPAATKATMEVMAEKAGNYGVEVEMKSPQSAGSLCSIKLEPPRDGTESEASLQQARTLIFESVTLKNTGKLNEAEKLLQKALELREKVLGPEDPALATPLSRLADIELARVDFPKAEALYNRALKVEEKGEPDPATLFSDLNDLAVIYAQTDRFEQAEQALLSAISIEEKAFGKGQPAAVNAMVNLANVYDEEGNYPKAQELFEQAAAEAERIEGPDSPGLAVILANLSGVYSERGDYAGGVRIGQRAVAIGEKSGQEGRRLALALVALGDAYRFQGDLDKAEPLYERSLKAYEKTLGPEDPLVADNLDFLADIRRQRHDLVNAEAFYKRALEIRKKKLGEDNSNVGASLDNLATLYMEQRDYARSEPLYRQALAIREKALGTEHPDVGATLTSLSALEMATGHAAEAELLLSRAISISEHNATLNLVAGSEREKLAYLKLSAVQLDRAITLNTSPGANQQAADLAITTVLERKGRVQDLLADNLNTLRQSLDADGVKLLDQLSEATTHLARLVVGGPQDAPIEEHMKRISALKEQREHLEAEISQRSAQFRAASQPVTLDAVRAALPADSALIEFVNYRKLAGLEDADPSAESRYIAYVIRPAGQVVWKELGDAATLDRAIDAYRQALRDPARKDIHQISRTLDEALLQPLRPLLGDAHHLLISTDGQLSLMPFEALVGGRNRYAIEDYSISYLSAGRDLLRMRVTAPSKTNPLVVADPVFGEAVTTLMASARRSDSRTRRRSITTAADLSKVYFAPLPATAQEARSIQTLFPESTVLTAGRATVAKIKQTVAPRILHIATHGFFLEDSGIEASHASEPMASTRGVQASLGIENPLLRSGLAFAGANISRAGKDSGILTALEAANLNLWGTKLVTLSACDTGIGEVRDREGVYGLRRSFVLAGAETLVMSLWPVSDYVTRELMTSYYTGLKRGLGRGEALRQAELAMMKQKAHEHPFYWASFIQSGEWANLDGKR